MEQLFLLTILVLQLIILLLLISALHPRKESNNQESITPTPAIEPKPNETSIIGESKVVMLKPPTKPIKKSATIPQQELNKAFVNEKYDDSIFDHKYKESKQDGVDTKDNEEPIYLEQTETPIENIELQKRVCLDYMQVESASRSIVRGENISDEDEESLRKLRGTELLNKVLEQMNGKFTDRAIDLIDKCGISQNFS